MNQTGHGGKIEIDLIALLRALWQKIWIILAAMAVCGLIAFAVARFFIPSTYVSSAQLYVNNARERDNGSITTSEISAATVIIGVLCLCMCLLWSAFIWKRRIQLYAWGFFSDQSVSVTVPFRKSYSLEYALCRGCGIGLYRHALMNNPQSPLGSNRFFIFLSLEPFDETFRFEINRWLSSETRIKIVFSESAYEYLMKVLPQKQAQMLEKDHAKFILRKCQ